MQAGPARHAQHPPAWKSWLVLLSLLTDPRYVSYRVRRRWARFRGRKPPPPSSPPAPCQPGRDLSDLVVDLVYLWVSGQDPKHREKRNYWLEQQGLAPAVFNPDVRYVEDDELRYSLRSVEAFVPWVRRIFIVTDDQVPPWLNRAHPKIEVVDHTQIIDPEWLPTFNTKVIINHIHRIPGLSEHFIYTNDDCFFGQPCRKEDFFEWVPDRDGGRVVMKILIPQGEKNYDSWILPAHLVREPLARLWMYSYNSLKVMLELRRPWRKIRYVDSHQSQPMIRSQLEAATKAYPREHRQTSASRFRNPHDISFISLARYRALENGTAKQGDMTRMFFPYESDLAGYTRDTLPALFCINAGLGDEALRRDRILARLFPEPSAFELPEAATVTA
jgi:hypothetical protein